MIILVGLCVYWNALDAPFLWDDHTAIVTNQTIRDLWPSWRPLLPPVETPVAARPLVNFSLALNYSIGRLDVRGYHVWNLGVHLAAALLLFGVVRQTLEGERLRERMEVNAANVALVAALWWTIHPLTSEVIDYTTQRTTAMMGLFFLLTLYSAIRAVGSRHPARWHTFAVIACACGMASKEAMAMAPLVVALYDRVFVFPTVREAFRARKPLYVGLASTWVGLGALIWLWPRSTVGFTAGDAWTYALNQAQVIPHYLGLAMWPHRLVLDYGVLRQVPPSDVIGGAVVLAGLLALTVVALARWPAVGFLGAAFFLTLAPTSSFVPIMSEVGAERRMYLPLAAIAVLLVMGGYRVLARARSAWPARDRLLTTAALVFAAAWLGSLGVRTAYRNAQYADALSLWGSSVEARPHGRARLAYAMALVSAGQSDAAVPHLREAVREYEPARYALGVELAARGENAEAIQVMKAFIDADPAAGNRVPARLLLGRLLFADRRFHESAEQFRAVAALAPANIDAQLSLGDLLLTQKRYSEAASQYRVVVGLQPNHADWRLRLGSALAESGQLAEAVEHFRAAVTLDPGNELARSSLNRAEQLLGDQ